MAIEGLSGSAGPLASALGTLAHKWLQLLQAEGQRTAMIHEPVRRGDGLLTAGCAAIELHPIDRHRLGDVLDLLLAHRLEAKGELLLDLLGNLARDIDVARLASCSSRAAILTPSP